MAQIKKLGDSQLEIEMEMSAEDFERFFNRALRDFKEKIELPGFRKGSASEKMVLEKVGEAVVLESAAELAIKDLWPKLLREEKIEAIGRPEFLITKLAKGNPLGLKIKTAVLSPIELPDYKKLAKVANLSKGEFEVVSDSEVNETLEALRKNNPAYFEKGTDENKMKEAIRQNLEFEKKRKAKDRHRMEILEKIVQASKMSIPEILIHSELDKMEHELKVSLKDMGLNWADYLTHVKKTEEELKKGWNEDAIKRVKYGLVLREISAKEGLAPSEKELDSQVDRILLEVGEEERKKASRDDLKEHIFGRLQNEMVLSQLENEK